MKKQAYYALCGFLIVLMAACTSLGLSADTFNQKVAAGYTTVTTIADSATLLYQSGHLSDADKANVVQQDENLKVGLDVAREVHATDTSSGDAKLKATLVALQALDAYLKSKQGIAP